MKMKSNAIVLVILMISFHGVAQNENNCNCCTPEYSEFDFWIGQWKVTNPNASPAGKNSIIKIQDNCALQENWISATPGYSGTSYNFYNANEQRWEQIWIDNQGQSLHLKGKRVGNKMILKSDKQTNKEGKQFYHQITWTSNGDGSVRQLWETFTDGNDPVIAFDGLYKKEN